MPVIDEFCTDYDLMFTNLVNGGVNYLRRNPTIENMIVGLSGGIDSFVATALAREVIGRHGKDIGLMGYSLPILTNEQEELDRAKLAGDSLCSYFSEVVLGNAFLNLIAPIDNSLYYEMYGHEAKQPLDSKIRAGNIKARLRMIFLYDKARKYNGIVLSTDNYTEFLLGFWTLHGDVGDFGFIQELWKTEVYGLAQHIADCGIAEEAAIACINAKPTDGLGVSDSDLSQLLPNWKGSYRGGYECIDEILMAYVNGNTYIKAGEDDLPIDTMIGTHPVLVRHLATHFKRDNPANLSRRQVLGLL